jgi:hypothetical protein
MTFSRYDISYKTRLGGFVHLTGLMTDAILDVVRTQLFFGVDDLVITQRRQNGQERDAVLNASRPRRESVGCWTLGDDGSSFPPA